MSYVNSTTVLLLLLVVIITVNYVIFYGKYHADHYSSTSTSTRIDFNSIDGGLSSKEEVLAKKDWKKSQGGEGGVRRSDDVDASIIRNNRDIEQLRSKLSRLNSIAWNRIGNDSKASLRPSLLTHVTARDQTVSKSIDSKTMHAVDIISTAKNNAIGNFTGRLHTVTYASHGGRDDRFCRAVESAIRHDYRLVILGWRVPWTGLSQKLQAAYEYASSLPPGDLLLFTDAFDVLFTGGPTEIIRQFLLHNSSLLFSAECGCWPHIMERKGRACFYEYPTAPTPYRYLNSGSWIGTALAAAAMLSEVIRLAGNDFRNANDQKLVADMFISRRFDMSLDYHNSIFQSMHMTRDPPLPLCDPSEDVQLTKDGSWLNSRTGGRPALLHFNGGGKPLHLGMEARMWYKDRRYNSPTDRQRLANYELLVPTHLQPNGTMQFRALCGSYLDST